ncbi:acyltransferase family protein [Cellulomonas palmilytica]|uniref:acyltransferase family protein n=1 Tax=Cellulomonas palmilytica TaxID=2608402 RepID=UPI001F32E2CA|nr:acyltransferase family protein [Cellulomonas palmilytica]UJP41129.1 acyltransferase [Cellulomonas palmilytica]
MTATSSARLAEQERADDVPTAQRLRGSASEIRPEIQALRAVAVLLVLAYHVAPARLPGGYIGVDVFFVISGFLITAHIVKPLRRGTFTFRGFYARRAVRLLPASLLVLAFTLAVTLAVVPQSRWPQFGQQIAASALYVENWVLAGNATDYSAPAANVSPVQHFWSLSAEEQFYLVWPALLLLGLLVSRRTRSWRLAFATVLVPLALVSLAWSVYRTAQEPSAAYFVTTTRAWEFAAGGLTWLVADRLGLLPRDRRALASWAGLAVIGACALLFSARTPFPGWVAGIPVVAAAAVLAAGLPETRWGPARIMRWRPVQVVGDMSYSLYLWHWPLIVLLPYVVSQASGARGRVAAVALAFPLAYLTRRYVEVPLMERYRPGSGSAHVRPGVIGVAVACAMALVAVPALAADRTVEHRREQAWAELDARVAAAGDCFGAAALDADCAPGGDVVPDPVIADLDDFGILNRGCQVRSTTTEARTCTFGDPSGATSVALVGDSHAAQWAPALDLVGEERGWKVTTYLRSGCPVTQTRPAGRGTSNEACGVWERNVLRALAEGDFDVVVTSALAGTVYTEDPSGVQGFTDAWAPLLEAGSQVVAIRDNPDPTHAGIPSTPVCVEERGPLGCGTDPGRSLRADPLVEAVSQTPGADLVDLTDRFCVEDTCPAVIGDVLVYHQAQHVTTTYMRSLAPSLGAALDEVLD